MTKAIKERGRPPIPDLIRTRLWTASGGRCEFDNCNKALWRNDLTMGEMNASYIAHIYAYSPNGPRYDAVLSPKLETNFSNLMLVCDVCHRTFDDKSKEVDYPAAKLIQMKNNHEERIEFLTSLQPERRSHIILYGATIGEHGSPLHFKQSTEAILPDYYPTSPHAIELGLKNSSFKDADANYWLIEYENLRNLFKEKVEYIKNNHPVQHYSIFALAPQPLLIQLGTLLNDLYPALVFQLHREPTTWKWVQENENIDYMVIEPGEIRKKVALKIALSATISDERIAAALDGEVSIWSISISVPSNDFLRSRKQLEILRNCFRNVFDRIKSKHGEDAELHVFPAMPISAAIELGRVWMPKADLPFSIYEQNRLKGGFFKTIKICQ